MARTRTMIITILLVALLATASGFFIGTLTDRGYTSNTTITSGTVTITTTNAQVSIVRETTTSTVTTSVTNSTSCRTLFNSIGCLIEGSGEASCLFLMDGGLMYVHVLNDSGKPIAGASITVNYAEEFCAGIVAVLTTTRAPIITNATGWAIDNERYIGNYSLFLNNEYNHTIFAFVSYNMSTFITIKIPSYNISTFYEPA